MSVDVEPTRDGLLSLLQGKIARSYIADEFPKYALLPRIGRFLSRYELFKQIVDVHGSIVECGVGQGSGLIGWYQISKLLEPLNRRRVDLRVRHVQRFSKRVEEGRPEGKTRRSGTCNVE